MDLQRIYRIEGTLGPNSLERIGDSIAADQRFTVLERSPQRLMIKRGSRNPLVLPVQLVAQFHDGADGNSIISLEALPVPGTFGDVFRAYPRMLEELAGVVFGALPDIGHAALDPTTAAGVLGTVPPDPTAPNPGSSVAEFAANYVVLGLVAGAVTLFGRAVGLPGVAIAVGVLGAVALGLVTARRRRGCRA